MSAAIKIGCDPELFSMKGYYYHPVHTWLKGSKKEPFKVKGGAFQVDGMAAEFNIDPASSAAEFDDNVRGVVNQLVLEAKKAGSRLLASPVVSFDREIWNITPDEYKVLGCDPDYGLDGEPLFDKKTEVALNANRYRTGSGHIHVGWGENIIITPDHLADCRGIAAVFEHVWDKIPIKSTDDKLRSRYYGLPGAHRPKPYGVELRKPSNNWLNYQDNKKSYQWVFNIVSEMMDRYMNEADMYKVLAVKIPELKFRQWGIDYK